MSLSENPSPKMAQADEEWGGNQDAFQDPEEKRALFGTLDSF